MEGWTDELHSCYDSKFSNMFTILCMQWTLYTCALAIEIHIKLIILAIEHGLCFHHFPINSDT